MKERDAIEAVKAAKYWVKHRKWLIANKVEI